MESLVDKGLVRAIGLSNFNARQTDDIISVARHKPVMNQVQWEFVTGPNKHISLVLTHNWEDVIVKHGQHCVYHCATGGMSSLFVPSWSPVPLSVRVMPV